MIGPSLKASLIELGRTFRAAPDEDLHAIAESVNLRGELWAARVIAAAELGRRASEDPDHNARYKAVPYLHTQSELRWAVKDTEFGTYPFNDLEEDTARDYARRENINAFR